MNFKGNFSATADFPDFVYKANATLAEIGDAPLYTLSLPRLEPIFKKWQWEVNNHIPEPPAKEPVRYLTRGDMAAVLRLSLVTLDKYTANGTLHAKRVGNRVLYDPTEAERALELIAANRFKK